MEGLAQGKLLTVRQACEQLGVCRSTLESLFRRGEVRPTRVGSRGVRVSVRELERYVDRGTVKSPQRAQASTRPSAGQPG